MSAAALVEAARYERDRRGSTYPAKLRAQGVRGTAEHDARADAYAVDYQAWVAIVEWLETDRFFGFYGGIPDDAPQGAAVGEACPERSRRDGRPDKWVSWPELELAAQSALVSVAAKLRKGGSGGAAPSGADKGGDGELQLRRDRLFCIHRRIQRHRQWLDETNRQLRAACGGG